MIASQHYMECIISELNKIRSEIKSKNSLGLTDDNIIMQDFMRDILNMAYQYELINLNSIQENFPGIDLGDKTRQIGFQITSTKAGKKIKDTLKVCEDNLCCHKYKNLKFFILTSKQSSYSIDYSNSFFEFDPNKDILDFDDIYKQINSFMDVDGKKQIFEYIQKEALPVKNLLGINSCEDDIVRELFFEIKNNETVLNLIKSYFIANHLSEIVLYPEEEKEWWVFDDGTPARSVMCPGSKGIHSLKVSTTHKDKIPLLKDREMRKDINKIYERYDIYCLANGFDKATAEQTCEIMEEIRNKYGEWLE